MQQDPMRAFDTASMAAADIYKLLSGSVIPRPIAWVSTVDSGGVYNLAPFSFFTAVCADPPTLLFCPARREPKGGLAATKDTLENIRQTGEFVVNIVSDETAEAMNQTAAQLPPEADEFAHAGVTPVAGAQVRAPRVAEAAVQMECRLQQIVEIGPEPPSAWIVIGKVLQFWVREAVLGPRMHIDPAELRAVGRLSGSGYVRTSDRFEMIRPK